MGDIKLNPSCERIRDLTAQLHRQGQLRQDPDVALHCKTLTAAYGAGSWNQ
jgi:hypothetical protein